MSYESTASLYDVIYGKKNYAQEADRVGQLAERHKLSQGKTLLDVACGTGLHLVHLQRPYRVTGLDLSEAQLAIARKQLPGVTLHQGDMTTFDLGQQFDVVTCLFSAIGHLLTLEELRAGTARMAAHVAAGGVLIVEPWLTPDKWKPGHVSIEESDGDGLHVIRVTITHREDRITHLEMHHFVSQPPQDCEHIVAQHQLALYDNEEYAQAFQAAGLRVAYDPDGLISHRGLFLGIKEPS